MLGWLGGVSAAELGMFRVVQRWHRESRSARGGCGWNARGWSEQGKRFRALEREAAATPGAFYYGHLRYEDDTAYPTEIESGLLATPNCTRAIPQSVFTS